jgi:hypothetical protein
MKTPLSINPGKTPGFNLGKVEGLISLTTAVIFNSPLWMKK